MLSADVRFIAAHVPRDVAALLDAAVLRRGTTNADYLRLALRRLLRADGFRVDVAGERKPRPRR